MTADASPAEAHPRSCPTASRTRRRTRAGGGIVAEPDARNDKAIARLIQMGFAPGRR